MRPTFYIFNQKFGKKSCSKIQKIGTPILENSYVKSGNVVFRNLKIQNFPDLTREFFRIGDTFRNTKTKITAKFSFEKRYDGIVAVRKSFKCDIKILAVI